jgi:hypothetical protein
LGDVGRYILRPALERVEADDANRIVVLPPKQVDDHRFQISGFYICFPVGAPQPTKIVQDDVDILIVAVRHDGRRPACSRHTKLHATN